MSDLPRNLDPGWMGAAERAALEEQGMFPDAPVASPLPCAGLPLNPALVDGECYWAWKDLGIGARWHIARYSSGVWRFVPERRLHHFVPGASVVLWRGPLVPPPAPV